MVKSILCSSWGHSCPSARLFSQQSQWPGKHHSAWCGSPLPVYCTTHLCAVPLPCKSHGISWTSFPASGNGAGSASLPFSWLRKQMSLHKIFFTVQGGRGGVGNCEKSSGSQDVHPAPISPEMAIAGKFWMCCTGYLAPFDLGHGLWLPIIGKQEPPTKPLIPPCYTQARHREQKGQVQIEVTVKVMLRVADLKPEPSFSPCPSWCGGPRGEWVGGEAAIPSWSTNFWGKVTIFILFACGGFSEFHGLCGLTLILFTYFCPYEKKVPEARICRMQFGTSSRAGKCQFMCPSVLGRLKKPAMKHVWGVCGASSCGRWCWWRRSPRAGDPWLTWTLNQSNAPGRPSLDLARCILSAFPEDAASGKRCCPDTLEYVHDWTPKVCVKTLRFWRANVEINLSCEGKAHTSVPLRTTFRLLNWSGLPLTSPCPPHFRFHLWDFQGWELTIGELPRRRMKGVLGKGICKINPSVTSISPPEYRMLWKC